MRKAGTRKEKLKKVKEMMMSQKQSGRWLVSPYTERQYLVGDECQQDDQRTDPPVIVILH